MQYSAKNYLGFMGMLITVKVMIFDMDCRVKTG